MKTINKGYIALAAAAAAVALFASPVGAATLGPVTASGCVATLDGVKLAVSSNFATDDTVTPGSVTVAFRVRGDSGDIPPVSGGHGPSETWTASTGINNSSSAVNDYIDLYAKYQVGDVDTIDQKIGECQIKALVVAPTPTPTPPVKSPPPAAETGDIVPTLPAGIVFLISASVACGVGALVVGGSYGIRRVVRQAR